jgi:2-keto-4-pentenoate hydratase/2-oxohepta-3-ene-1,7-dioic acid hydratase in catechol pathway
MKLGRFLLDDKSIIAVFYEENWIPLAELPVDQDLAVDMIALLDAWPEQKTRIMAALQQRAGQPLPERAVPQLPFEPKSLRDFMLSETHAIDAARGMVKRFIPKAALVVKVFEKITGRVFPALKPKPIWYRQPVYYFSNHLNVVTDGALIQWPAFTKDLDYELELAFVITKPLYNATPEEAMSAVGGFLILNDFSARDVQLEEMRSGFGPPKSKHFLNALSHTVATADDILPQVNRLRGKVQINGHRVCESTTAGMRHSISDVLVHVSRGEHLHPGEVFGLGTMPGGCGLENGHWLQPGDHIELVIDQVGSLSNRIGK